VILKDPSVPVRSLLAALTGLFCFAVRRSMIDVVDLVKMQVLGSLEAGTRGITDLAMSPNTLYVAAGGEDEIVRIWETSSQKLRIIVRPKSGKISAIAFAPDSQVFAICTANGDLQLWDLFTEQMMQKLRHQGTASVVQFSPDGRAIVVGNTDSTVAVYTR
jgi:WD40 repeat protein